MRSIGGGILVIASVIVVAITSWGPLATERGRLIAHSDIKEGHLKLLTYGLPPPSREEYAQLLRDRYQIELQVVADCIVSESLRNYVSGYNEISMASANRRFGHDVFKESEEQAENDWETKRSQAIALGEQNR